MDTNLTGFEERSCYCGETVQHPPIPCGTPLLQCKMQCTRIHPCGHDRMYCSHYSFKNSCSYRIDMSSVERFSRFSIEEDCV